MKARGILLATVALLVTAPLADAAERPRPPSPSKIVEIVEQFNELRHRKALAYTTKGEEGTGSRISYMKSPYERGCDGGYTANIEWNLVNSISGQSPQVQKSHHVFRLTAVGDRVMFSYGEAHVGDMDVELAGNGILVRPQNKAVGVELMENLRRPDGSVRIVQHYAGGIQRPMVFDEVAVPPARGDNAPNGAMEFKHRVFVPR